MTTLDPLETICSALRDSRGALTALNLEAHGIFGTALADLDAGMHFLGCAAAPIDVPVTVVPLMSIVAALVVEEGALRQMILDAPAANTRRAAALAHVSKAINGAIGGHARHARRGETS